MYFVYSLKSLSRNYIYVGITDNIERRFEQYQSGRYKTTRAYRLLKIILIEKYLTRQEARNREKYIKSGNGKEF